MADIDEMSRIIGRMEGKMDSLQEEVAYIKEHHGKKIDRIDSNLTNTRLKVAGIAGTTGLLTGAMAQGIMEWLKIKIGGGSH